MYLLIFLVDILHAYADPRVKERYIAEGDKGQKERFMQGSWSLKRKKKKQMVHVKMHATVRE